MNNDATDFISNVAHQTACDVLSKLKAAAEYFREDSDATAKVVTLHHYVITFMISDFIELYTDHLQIDAEKIFEGMLQDVKETIKDRLKNG